MACFSSLVSRNLAHLALAILAYSDDSAPKEINSMAHRDETQSEPQIFVLKQGPHESLAAFEARISDITNEISGSDYDRPVILYSVAQPALSPASSDFAR